MIIKNCRIFYAKLDPNRPNARYSKDNPRWEVQLRTTDPEQRELWAEQNLHPKLMVHKKGDEEGMPLVDENGKRQWRVNLKKSSTDKDGNRKDPVQVVNAKRQAVDPSTIGNGSIANIRTFQYEYTRDDETKIANVLMGVQLVHHIIYEPTFEDFDDEGETTIEAAPENDDSGGHNDDNDGNDGEHDVSPLPDDDFAPDDTLPQSASVTAPSAPKTPKAPGAPKAKADF